MANGKRSFFMIMLTVLFATGGMTTTTVWSSDVPATAGDFAAYCTPIKEGCSTEITYAQLGGTGSQPTSVCGVPEGIERRSGEKAIVEWLSSHKEVANMRTRDGIQAAIKSLWNCQKSVATGVTNWGAPDKIGAFVAFCADGKNYVTCANQIVQASINAYFAQASDGHSLHCTTPDNIEDDVVFAKVLSWLKEHREMYGERTVDGTTAAIDHLWPCPH